MRLIKKEYRIPIVCLLGCLVSAVVLSLCRPVLAAEKVDMARKGTLTLTLGAEDSTQMGQDMARITEPVKVHVWKIADMSETGGYEFQGDFQGLSLEKDDWKALSEKALALVYDLDENGKPFGEPKVSPVRTETFEVTEEGNKIEAEVFSELDLGLYLVTVDSAVSPKYEYTFTPMVVSLPWSEYQYLGGSASDEWQYDREATLKPARTLRYGDVRIVKTLTAYNASQLDVTCVFDVTVTDPETGKVVYSNVVSATFSAVGVKEILLEHFPAEAVVTVKEVYSGANCQVTVSDNEPKAVVANEMDGSTEPITFRFENKYKEELKSGYGVENRFRYDTEAQTYVWTTDRDDISP